jgi:hypothetical protein
MTALCRAAVFLRPPYIRPVKVFPKSRQHITEGCSRRLGSYIVLGSLYWTSTYAPKNGTTRPHVRRQSPARYGAGHQAEKEAGSVLDLFFLILTVVFFVGCLAYIVGCERL